MEQRDLAGARAELNRTAAIAGSGSAEQAKQLGLEACAWRQAGQTAEAVRICEDLLGHGQTVTTPWCRCYAAWLAADVAAAEGAKDLARQFLALARRNAKAAQDPSLWNRITALQTRLDTE